MSKLKCPTWLDDEAKKEWKRIANDEFVDEKEITQRDSKALEGYCQSYSRWRQCEETLQKQGYTFTTPNGYIQQRPEVAIANKALAEIRSWAKELGFTPASRCRMNKNNIANENNDDEMDDMVVK